MLTNELNIMLFKQDNLGGAQKIEFIPINNLISVGPEFAGKCAEPLVFKPGKASASARFPIDKLDIDWKKGFDKGNKFFQYKVTAIYPKIRLEVTEAIKSLDREPYILIYTDNNDQRYLLGDMTNPVRLMYDGTHGKKVADLNSYELNFEIKLPGPAPLYQY